MMLCRRVSLRRYNRGTGTSGKHFSCRSNSSLWARSRTFCFQVKMRSHGFRASRKRSHPRQPGSAFRSSRHWVLSGCRRIRFLRVLRRLPGLQEAFPPEAIRKRLFGCGLLRPLRNRRHARGASSVAFLRRLGAAAPGRHSR